jgi:hypothetical protein
MPPRSISNETAPQPVPPLQESKVPPEVGTTDAMSALLFAAEAIKELQQRVDQLETKLS